MARVLEQLDGTYFRHLTDICNHADTNSQRAFHSYQHIGLMSLVGTVQIFHWGVQVPLLDALAKTFRLLLEELWN